MDPPWASTARLHYTSPRPTPVVFVVWNGVKRYSFSSTGMLTPVLLTERIKLPLFRSPFTISTSPPDITSTAFRMRLSKTRLIWVGSTEMDFKPSLRPTSTWMFSGTDASETAFSTRSSTSESCLLEVPGAESKTLEDIYGVINRVVAIFMNSSVLSGKSFIKLSTTVFKRYFLYPLSSITGK